MAPELMKLIFTVLYVSCVIKRKVFTLIFAVFLQYFMLFLLVTPI